MGFRGSAEPRNLPTLRGIVVRRLRVIPSARVRSTRRLGDPTNSAHHDPAR